MISQTDIQATCDDIVREFAPLQIILFGSYAYGTPTEHSDVDLLVVMPIPKSENKPNSTYRCRITKCIWKRKTQILTKMQKSYKIKSVFNFLLFHT